MVRTHPRHGGIGKEHEATCPVVKLSRAHICQLRHLYLYPQVASFLRDTSHLYDPPSLSSSSSPSTRLLTPSFGTGEDAVTLVSVPVPAGPGGDVGARSAVDSRAPLGFLEEQAT